MQVLSENGVRLEPCVPPIRPTSMAMANSPTRWRRAVRAITTMAVMGALILTAPPPATATCGGSEQGVWWTNNVSVVILQRGTQNRIRKTVHTIEQCGANSGLPVVHTAHVFLNGTYGNWAELGIAARYNTSGSQYYRVFKEWGIGFQTLGVYGYDTAPCSAITVSSNSGYGRFQVYYSTSAGNWRFYLDCEDLLGNRYLGNAGTPGGYTNGWAGAEYARTWTASSVSGYQKELKYLDGLNSWTNWASSRCIHDNLPNYKGSAPSSTSWQVVSGTQSC